MKSAVLATKDVGVAKITLLRVTTDCEMLLDDDTRYVVSQECADSVMRLWEQERHVVVRVDITLIAAPRKATQAPRADGAPMVAERELYWVHLPRGTIGLSAANGIVTTAHTSISWAIGKQLSEVESYARGYGGEVERADREPRPAE